MSDENDVSKKQPTKEVEKFNEQDEKEFIEKIKSQLALEDENSIMLAIGMIKFVP